MTFAFPAPPEPLDATSPEAAEQKVRRVHEQAAAWTSVPIEEHIALVHALRDSVHAERHAWADAIGRLKGGETGSEAWAEAMGDGPVATLIGLRLLEETLVRLRDTGSTGIGSDRLSTRPDGRLVARVFPNTLLDRLLFTGFSGEVWMQPGITAENLAEHTATEFPEATHDGRVCLVLGAGNISSIPPLDAVTKIFVDKTVCVLKMNPVNETVGPVFERALAPLIERGVLEIVYGGAEIGELLCSHADIDEIHITGSDRTYDAIVWGPPNEREARKQRGDRVNDTPVSAELGNITPILVTPGRWTDAELVEQAKNVASMATHNASFNCAAGKLIVTARGWDQREAFLEALREAFRSAAPRKAYYPGAVDRWQEIRSAYPQAEIVGERPHDAVVPWTLITDLDAEADQLAFRMEPFCGVMFEVSVPGEKATDFLPAAVEFVNEKVWGSLCCAIIISDRSRADSASEQAFQEALDELRYGSIAINHWAGVGFAFGELTWGAHPGHTPEDIGSGVGHVHNAFMFAKPQKSVIYGPFKPMLKMPWHFDHTRKREVLTRMADMYHAPSLLRVPMIALHSLLA